MKSEKTLANRNKAGSAAVILAAGYSSRMGAFKPLLEIGGKAVVSHLIDTCLRSGIGRIIVVTGHEHGLLEKHIEENCIDGIVTVYNERYPEGMFTSIQKGIDAAARNGSERGGAEPAGVFLMPVDLPLISADTIVKLKEAVTAAGRDDCFFVPVFRGKKGHPLYVPGKYFEEIAAYSGKGGLKGVTEKYADLMTKVPVDDEGCVMDMDEPDAYMEMKEFFENGAGPALSELAKGRRIIFVRHGRIEQHREKIFLGQTDVPLDDEGRRQAAAAAEKLAGYGIKTDRIYSSPLSRCTETAKVIAARSGAGKPEVAVKDGLCEMSLGSWDGRYISEIRQEHPDLYERRGHDLFAFKTGNGSENFFDMQYRAVKALKDILKEDKSKDILIVSHKGVIRALENNLRGKGVEQDWQELENGGIRIVCCESGAE